MNGRLRGTVILLCFILAAVSGQAQPEFDLEDIRVKYPGDDAYFLTDKAGLRIVLKDDKLEMSLTVTDEILLLTEKANYFSKKSIYYYEETQTISDIDAASYIPQENKRLKKLPVGKIFTDKPRKDNIFYDDMKEIYFNYSALKPGAVTSLTYTKKTKDPHFLDPFYFGNNSPGREYEYSVTFPKDVRIGYILRGDTSGITFSQSEARGETTYTWQAKNCPSYDHLEEVGIWRTYVPHIIVYIKSYRTLAGEQPVLANLGQLHDWYRSHVNSLETAVPEDVKLLSDSLTIGLSGELPKIKAIYYWVQDNIKYIAFENGLGGFIPRKASLVCSRRFGDCKDKSSLLYALLKAAGIRSYFTWIGTRDIPYSYKDVHTPMADNHMILSYYDNGHWIFLDGTAEGLPYGYPSSHIQEKEALISVSPDSFLVVKVQSPVKEKNIRADSLLIRINPAGVTGEGRTSFSGLWKTEVMHDFHDSPSNKKMELARSYFTYGNNKCRVDSLSDRGLNDYSDSAVFDYSFVIPEFARKVDKKLFLNMHLKKTWQGDIIEPEKKRMEIRYRFRCEMRQRLVLEIPAGYKLVKMPSAASHSTGSFGFNFSYHNEGSRVVMEGKIWMDELVIPRSQFEEWNSMIRSLDEAYGQTVVLEQK